MTRPAPRIISSVFDEDTRAVLLALMTDVWKRNVDDQPGFGRIISNDPRLRKYLDDLTPLARELFNSPTLKPSYLCASKYDNPTSNLFKHKDKNACTYTIDYCVRQREPWGLFVEGVEYVLQENEALVFYGEEQEHWRGPFPDRNVVEMIFFHWVEPDHWFFNPEKPRPE